MAVFIKEKMNLLFVCSANKNRSKTAEEYFQKKYPNFKVLSAGINRKACAKEGSTFLTDELLEWADIIFTMEEKHKNIIQENTLSNVAYKIKVLNIEDIYTYNQPELIEILDSKTCGFQARVKSDKTIIESKVNQERESKLLIYDQDYEITNFYNIIKNKDLEAYTETWVKNYIDQRADSIIKYEYLEYLEYSISEYSNVNIKLRHDSYVSLGIEYPEQEFYISFSYIELDKNPIWEPGGNIMYFTPLKPTKTIIQ